MFKKLKINSKMLPMWMLGLFFLGSGFTMFFIPKLAPRPQDCILLMLGGALFLLSQNRKDFLKLAIGMVFTSMAFTVLSGICHNWMNQFLEHIELYCQHRCK